jgi:hypothetical protein
LVSEYTIRLEVQGFRDLSVSICVYLWLIGRRWKLGASRLEAAGEKTGLTGLCRISPWLCASVVLIRVNPCPSVVETSGVDTMRSGVDVLKLGAGQTRHGLRQTRHGVGINKLGERQTRHGLRQTGLGAWQTGHGFGINKSGAWQTGHGLRQTRLGLRQTGHGVR